MLGLVQILIDSALILARGFWVYYFCYSNCNYIDYLQSFHLVKKKTSNLVNGITDITDKIAKKNHQAKKSRERDCFITPYILCQDSQNENNENNSPR